MESNVKRLLTYNSRETTLQRLSSLKLQPVFNLRTNSINSISLLELFGGSTGGYAARRAFARIKHDEDTLAQWQLSLLPYVNCLFYIMYPIFLILVLKTHVFYVFS